MFKCVSSEAPQFPWSAAFLLMALALPTVLGCSSDTVEDKQTVAAPKSVEEIETTEQAAAFLHHALREAQHFYVESPSLVALDAQQRAVDVLQLAIQWLEGEAPIEATEISTVERQKEEQTLLGVWRHRLHSDGRENVIVFGPQTTFVAYSGGCVWVGNWERRDNLLYMQNVRESGFDDSLGLPSIQRIAINVDGSIGLVSIPHEDKPGFTLTRIM